MSFTDPQARWTAAPGGPAFYAYSTNYLIDTEHAVIVDVEATTAHRTAEVEAAKTKIDRVEARFALEPQRLIGDMAYGTAPMLAWMIEDKGIEPHVPVWDKTQRGDDTFSSGNFEWNEEADEYRCPGGKPLRREWRVFKDAPTHVTKADTIIYRSTKSDCAQCPMKNRCCPNTSIRKIARSIYETSRNVARRISTTALYRRSRRERKKVEMLFAHQKRILNLDRLRLRGLSGAKDEFTLAAVAQNLRRLATLMPQGPPNGIGVRLDEQTKEQTRNRLESRIKALSASRPRPPQRAHHPRAARCHRVFQRNLPEGTVRCRERRRFSSWRLAAKTRHRNEPEFDHAVNCRRRSRVTRDSACPTFLVHNHAAGQEFLY